MAADYMIKYPCEVRKQVTDDQLMEMLKTRGRVETIVAQLMKQQPGMTREQIAGNIKIKIMTRRPNGVQEPRDVTLGELAAQAAPLDRLNQHCVKCPANRAGMAFGCSGVVNFPFSRKAEEWLLARFPDDPKSPALSLLFKFLKDVGVKGAGPASQRGRKDLFESSKAPSRSWGGLFSRQSIDTNQILEVILLGGAKSYDLPYVVLMAQLFNFANPDWSAGRSVPQDSCVAQLKIYMQAIALAAELKSAVFMDS